MVGEEGGRRGGRGGGGRKEGRKEGGEQEEGEGTRKRMEEERQVREGKGRRVYGWEKEIEERIEQGRREEEEGMKGKEF